jgi:excisionase family DNA binding protein
MRQDQRRRNESKLGSPIPVDKPLSGGSIPFAERLTCTVKEACDATGLGRTKLYELIGAGCVSTTTIGRRRLVVVRSLKSLLVSG